MVVINFAKKFSVTNLLKNDSNGLSIIRY